MTGQEEKKEHKEEEEERHFNERDTLVGAIHILSNLKEDGELTTWETSAVELSLQLLLRELDWIDGKLVPPEGFDIGEEDDNPVVVPKGIEVGVEGIVKAVEQGEVYGYV